MTATGRVDYFALARHLGALPITATCADLIAGLEEYGYSVPESVREMPGDSEWMWGLFKLCDDLKRQNPRFIPDLFMEWTLSDK